MESDFLRGRDDTVWGIPSAQVETKESKLVRKTKAEDNHPSHPLRENTRPSKWDVLEREVAGRLARPLSGEKLCTHSTTRFFSLPPF